MDLADSQAETIEAETNGGTAARRYRGASVRAEIDGDTGHNGSANLCAFSEAQ